MALSGDEGRNREVRAVHLQSGDVIPADLVIVEIGVEPATDFLDSSFCQPDQSILVDAHFQVDQDIFAAGDIATFPNPHTGAPVRIEHWRLAMQQSQIAARNMAGEAVRFSGIPFFRSSQFELKLRCVGHAEEWDSVLIEGDLEERTFLAFYIRHNQILAVAGCGRDRDMAAISELMRLKEMPDADHVATRGIPQKPWGDRLEEAMSKANCVVSTVCYGY